MHLYSGAKTYRLSLITQRNIYKPNRTEHIYIFESSPNRYRVTSILKKKHLVIFLKTFVAIGPHTAIGWWISKRDWRGGGVGCTPSEHWPVSSPHLGEEWGNSSLCLFLLLKSVSYELSPCIDVSRWGPRKRISLYSTNGSVFVTGSGLCVCRRDVVIVLRSTYRRW